MIDKITTLIKQGDMKVPRLLICHYQDLKLSDGELGLLIYLLNQPDITFNPVLYSQELNMTKENILKIINTLLDKDLIKIVTTKQKSIVTETVTFDELYKKLAFFVINEQAPMETDLYSTFEKEFGRTLSNMEYEIINGWLNDFTDEIILLALKEAIYNGVTNLRYVDKILYEWKKKGVKTAKDVENIRTKFNESKKETKELYDYDWLNDKNDH